jgi:hypothetical protein
MRKVTTIQQNNNNSFHYNNNYNSKISPYSRFIYALNALESKRQYPTRLSILRFLEIRWINNRRKSK